MQGASGYLPRKALPWHSRKISIVSIELASFQFYRFGSDLAERWSLQAGQLYEVLPKEFG